MQHWSKNNAIVILMMVPIASLYAFSLDLYLPLLPKVQQFFGSSILYLQMGNSLFFLGFGLGQLVFGPISDTIGRRPVIIFSLSLYILGSIIIVLSESINVFIIARIIQAVGACGGYLCCFATIRDLYSCPKNSAEMFSYLNAFLAISATCAPTIGTILGYGHSWKIAFVVLLGLGLSALALSVIKYAETFPKPTNKTGIKYKEVSKNYKKIFCNINYQLYTFAAAIGMGSFFAFYSISPYLYQMTLHLTTMEFGLLYGSCGIVFLLGSYICGKTIKHTGIYKSLMIGLIIHLLGCLIIVLSHIVTGGTQIAPTHCGIILIIFGASFLVSAGIGGTMAPFEDIAGSAFAMIGSYKFIFAEILGTCIAAIYNNNALSLGATLMTLNVVAITLMTIYKNRLAEH
jgi:Bcr/CflA subfamily drug resistance transporter